MLRFTPLLFAAALLAQPAQAAVTYTWQQVEASSSMPANLNLELRFSDAAVTQGQLSLDIDNQCNFGGSCEVQPDSLISLRYWYGSPGAPHGGANLIDYRYNRKPAGLYDRILLDLTFLPGGLLSGSLFASNGSSDFELSSIGSLFRVDRANSDEEGGCGFQYPSCQGSTGLLVEVPEPSSAALAGLGLFAAWFARRRKHRA